MFATRPSSASCSASRSLQMAATRSAAAPASAIELGLQVLGRIDELVDDLQHNTAGWLDLVHGAHDLAHEVSGEFARLGVPGQCRLGAALEAGLTQPVLRRQG